MGKRIVGPKTEKGIDDLFGSKKKRRRKTKKKRKSSSKRKKSKSK